MANGDRKGNEGNVWRKLRKGTRWKDREEKER